MRILIVDDDSVTRKVLTSLLFEVGDCDSASNGEEAIEAVKRSMEEGKPYKLICMDIMMPSLDGQETLQTIRTLEEDKDIPVIDRAHVFMITALSDAANVMKAFGERCDAYLVKPIEKDKLFQELKNRNLL
ncbi:response regulator [Spirochaeta cellobiosiphila]|uniref:response regulator n=1 Tax=Spirochaeta cellobiosiphila TaxID=504483 RepID=UPI000416616A|nr:response regulator [Spirochaeta cellobiosiphila]